MATVEPQARAAYTVNKSHHTLISYFQIPYKPTHHLPKEESTEMEGDERKINPVMGWGGWREVHCVFNYSMGV